MISHVAITRLMGQNTFRILPGGGSLDLTALGFQSRASCQSSIKIQAPCLSRL